MNDKQLLDLAAKAAGVRLEWDGNPDAWQPMYYEGKTYHSWNPLTDDGDALRLAMTLSLHIEWRFDGRVAVSPRDEVADIYCMESTREDKQSATRRAIVRAAAAIGGTQPSNDGGGCE